MAPSSTLVDRTSDRTFFAFNAVLSACALAFIGYILVLRRGTGGTVDLSFMPGLNAALNGLSACLLAAGWVAIKRRRVLIHRVCMTSAFAASAIFLVGYLSYHFVHGDTRFGGTGAIRAVYFATLLSHILLSMSVVPMALTAFYFAFKRQFERHRRLTRWALPIWLYVSVTGVAIYVLLRAHPVGG